MHGSGFPRLSHASASFTCVTFADTLQLRKARGAFFTPPDLCRYVVEWAIREPGQSVLEPSAGEAAFLLAAAERMHALAGGRRSAGRLDGVELDDGSAAAAEHVLRQAGHDARVRTADFFTVDPDAAYDAVVGNPPYVRYQDFTGASRARSRKSALRAGVALTNLASSWAAFTVHAALFLRPGGRLGLVLPAELLSVNYAADVRRFLLQRFSRVRLVTFTQRVFPDVLEEVVLLLAEGQGPTDRFELLQARDVTELLAGGGERSVWAPTSLESKWTSALMPGTAALAYSQAVADPAMVPLRAWGETTLGIVTGANKFFALPPAQVRDLGLSEEDLLPVSPPGSRHLRGLTLSRRAWRELGEGGSRTWLFRPPGELDAAAQRYVAAGEALGLDAAYKCRVRRPWWRVPLVPPADLLLTYMNADTPRLTTNHAKAYHLNSVHGIYLKDPHKQLGCDLLPVAALNTVTMLGAETIGRAYGGGMLKLEPKEADVWPVPSPKLVSGVEARLRKVRPAVARRLRAGDLLEAVRLVDEVVLRDAMCIPTHTMSVLEEARAHLMARRVARGGRPGAPA
jgi:adenine-specific DNA-methyltransferase